ncbi:MAG: hypothetical protein WC843_03320 [Candidatus Gracilibacteria bacterium]|jgi:hypothetical protein
MNIKKTFIAGISLCLLILAGCQNSASNQANQPITSVQSSSQQGSQTSAADTAAFNGAVQLKDAKFCDKVIDATYQKACQTAVADVIAMDEALNKLDESICAKIFSKDQQNACKISVEVGLKDKENALLRNKEIEKENQIIGSGDYTACAKQLTDKILISTCELNILENKAIQTKDSSLCDKISLPEDQVRCKNGLKDSISQ